MRIKNIMTLTNVYKNIKLPNKRNVQSNEFESYIFHTVFK